MAFHKIDPAAWPRREYYEHYMHAARCTYSMTAEVEISALLAALKARGLRFYPALLYLCARAVNENENLRYATDDEGNVGIHDVVHPAYTISHREDELFSCICTRYSADFAAFYRAACADMGTYAGAKTLFPQPDMPANTFDVSSIPWAHFTGFNLNLYTSGSWLPPILTCGKYAEGADGKILLPVSLQVHHAVTDGYHTARFFTRVQQLCDEYESWLNLN